LLEPGAPSPDLRLSALQKLNLSGINTAVRINPLLPQELYEATEDSASRFVHEFSKVGVNTIIAGGLRIMSKKADYGSIASAEFINDAFQTDDLFRDFKIKNVMREKKGTYYIPESKLLRQYSELKQECDKNDISFTVCHDSNENAEKPEFKKLWHNKDDCCNGYGKVRGFRITFQQLIEQLELNDF
jgi:DNA repair photolyase